MSILSKAFYRFSAIPIKIPVTFFCRNRKIHSTLKSQNNIETEQSWRSHTSGFKAFCEVTVSKVVWYWHKDRHMGQGDGIESPEISPHTCGQGHGRSVGKRTVSTAGAGKTGYPHAKNIVGALPCPHAKIKLKWIKGLSVRADAKEQVKSFMPLDLAVLSWIWQQKHRRQKKKNRKLNAIHQRTTEWKDSPHDGRKSLQSIYLTRSYYPELLGLGNNSKTPTNNPIQKWVKSLNRHFAREDTQMANKHTQRCSWWPPAAGRREEWERGSCV